MAVCTGPCSLLLLYTAPTQTLNNELQCKGACLQWQLDAQNGSQVGDVTPSSTAHLHHNSVPRCSTARRTNSNP